MKRQIMQQCPPICRGVWAAFSNIMKFGGKRMDTTTNYELPQWVKADQIKMDDFNDALARSTRR